MAEQHNPVTSTVRQLLMNELGLTRESVRTEMEKIVAETAKRMSDRIDHVIERVVREEVNKSIRRKEFADMSDYVSRTVAMEVGTRVGNEVREHLKKLSFTVTSG